MSEGANYMLGKTAGGLTWMFRYLERADNMARLVETGLRIALTRSGSANEEWRSVLATAGTEAAYAARGKPFEAAPVIDFMLRDTSNSSSVASSVASARTNARLVRTALTREVWEATNEFWMKMATALARPVKMADLPELLRSIKNHAAEVRGALHGTMLRNEIYNFARIGSFIEQADNTARILDVKYYVLLPSHAYVGSSLDNVQWENILRSVSAHHAFRWLNPGNMQPKAIADFLILDHRFPRSLAYCYEKLVSNIGHLSTGAAVGQRLESQRIAGDIYARLNKTGIDSIFDAGLHEFLVDFLRQNNALAAAVERDFQFNQ